VASENRPYDLATSDHDYPDRSGPPARTLLICTHPRSGSTLLGEALYFAGDLGCPLEYFHIGFRHRFEKQWGVSDTRDLARAVWRHRTAPNGVLAVKLMWRDVQELALELDPAGLTEIRSSPPENVSPDTYQRLARLLKSILPNPTCIHLSRQDRVRQAISSMIATQTGQWRALPGAEMPQLREPEYDDDAIMRLIAYSDFCHGHWGNLVAAMDAPSLSVTYEDLVRDYAASTSGLFRALGSDASPPPTRMRRQANQTSEAFVARFLQERGILAAP